jgi:hypothetical protein
MSVLLDECLEAIEGARLLDDVDARSVIESFYNAFPTGWWGRLDWSAIDDSGEFESFDELLGIEGMREREVCVFWGTGVDASVMACALEDAVDAIDDVLAVGFETWFYDVDAGIVVEVYGGTVRWGRRG